LLLTKADKLASGARKAQLNMVREAVVPFMGDIQVEAFSSPEKIWGRQTEPETEHLV
jgi:GTP-binding protein